MGVATGVTTDPAAVAVGIQADDLTGACDTGAPFARRGLETVVLLPSAPIPARASAVIILDTESRREDPGVACARARASGERLRRAGAQLLYKKVDSTLRGAIGAELRGLLEGTGLRRVLLAPSFPGQGRTVECALLVVHGRPVDETAVARDPTFPRTGASVLALLGAAGPHPALAVSLGCVRRGPAAVRERLEHLEGAFVADAETDDDLATLAAAGAETDTLLAGSAGLAAALAGLMAGAPSRGEGGGAARPAGPPAVHGPLLVVAGSAHPVTRGQVAHLRGDDGLWPADAAGFEDALRRADTARRLAAATRERVEHRRPGALLVTGGETALAVCRALEATGLSLAGEIEPGLALGALLDGPFAGLPVITKAGGFGDPETLVRVREACG
jgi:uncharacterized protein YgbK (DUF1537 family)